MRFFFLGVFLEDRRISASIFAMVSLGAKKKNEWIGANQTFASVRQRHATNSGLSAALLGVLYFLRTVETSFMKRPAVPYERSAPVIDTVDLLH